ncbi:MAG: biotin-dependent carboxyltransferase family protein [Robiginitomaculum sp.]
MSLTVIKPGLQTSVQDGGRPGYRHMGMPSSGAADKLSLALANYCVGNRAHAAALECTLIGPSLKFNAAHSFAICGANVSARLNARPVAMDKGHDAQAGDILEIGAIHKGTRCYLSISGGLLGEGFLASVSTYAYARIGGVDGRFLKAGDRLDLGALSNTATTALPAGFAPPYGGELILRIMEGPEFNSLTGKAKRLLTTAPYTAGRQTDRMGARLDGPPLRLAKTKPLTSAALRVGTVQCPPDGTPILMLVDGHCTGGYVRAAQVIEADRHLLGQIAPGTKIRFVQCNREEALAALKAKRALYNWVLGGS